MRRPDSLETELHGFTSRVQALRDAGQPVKIQVGFGWTPAPGFINLEIDPHLDEDDHRFDHVDVFYFPYADMPWPIPDNSVDFIFHEDFIEHITQKQQVCFLAETLRVLKDGCFHRVSTPCLRGSMNRHSDFSKGMKGVYTGEWDNWQHVSLFTRNSLEEMARMVGYRDVAFTQKNQGVSPHSLTNEVRPSADRDPVFGNVFADLFKLGEVPRRQFPLEEMLELFDEAHYLKTYGDVANAVKAGSFPSGRAHYIRAGFNEGRAPFRLDPIWYVEQYPTAPTEILQAGYRDLIQHFIAIGRARGYRPHRP